MRQETELTLEFDLKTGELELGPLKRLADGFVVVRHVLERAAAEWKSEERVRFLPIVVGADGVHPEHDLLGLRVLCEGVSRKTSTTSATYLVVVLIGQRNQGDHSESQQLNTVHTLCRVSGERMHATSRPVKEA